MKPKEQNGRAQAKVYSPSALAFLKQLEVLCDVRTGLPITSHRPAPIGPALVFAKTAFRAMFQLFINELMRKQFQFNEALVALAHVIYRDINSVESATLAMRAGFQERIRALEEAVSRLEHQQQAPGADLESNKPKPIGLGNVKSEKN